MNKLTHLEYFNKVIEELESMDYPNMIVEFDTIQVARSMTNTIIIFKSLDLSYRRCAITIWALTMTEQIIPSTKDQVRH